MHIWKFIIELLHENILLYPHLDPFYYSYIFVNILLFPNDLYYPFFHEYFPIFLICDLYTYILHFDML